MNTLLVSSTPRKKPSNNCLILLIVVDPPTPCYNDETKRRTRRKGEHNSCEALTQICIVSTAGKITQWADAYSARTYWIAQITKGPAVHASQADLIVVLASASEPCIHFSHFYEYPRQGENITGRQKCAQHLACQRGDIKKPNII